MNSIIRIKENRDFRRIYARGKSLVSPYVVVYFMKNRRGNIRLGITAGKKIGTAVARNRAKRLIRAAFRSCMPNICAGFDFVVVARTRILSVKSTAVEKSVIKLLKSAGLYELSENE
jgi:ribonuclease P protein component